jgi:hypothetical protein
MKKALVEDGIARSPIVLGRVKGWRIGMLSDFFDLLEWLRWSEGCGISVYGERREERFDV